MFRHTVKDASVVILAFDLTNALSLRKLEAFYDQLNKIGQKNLFLVGCKYDEFLKKDKGYVQKMTDLVNYSFLFNFLLFQYNF